MKALGYILLIIGVFFGISVAALGLKALFFPLHVAEKEVQLGHDVVDKTLDADNAIYNYEWFKRQKEQIDATNKKLQIADEAAASFSEEAGPRKDWTFEDKNESARLHAISQGIESQLKDMIAEYNARTKMANRNIFEDGILPDFIDATTFIFKQ